MKAQFRAKDGHIVEVPVRYIPLDVMRIDSEYQRGVQQHRVQTIVSGFNPMELGVLHVNLRNGTQYVVDGQHRFLALRELGFESAQCVAWEGLTIEQEAALFVALNRNRKPVNAWDLWRADLRAGDQAVVMMQRIVADAGFKISRTSGHYHFAAVGALRRIFMLGGPQGARLLRLTMEAIARMYPVDDRAIDGVVVEGVAVFLWSYEADAVFERTRLDKTLLIHPASELIGKARAIVRKHREEEGSGGLGPQYVSRAIAEFYNTGLPQKRRVGEPRTANGKRRTAGRTRTAIQHQ